jgi:hypothetical protein
MSSPGVPRSSQVLLPTHRQLDELDSLIQQMLELPVNSFGNEGCVGPGADTGATLAPPLSAEGPVAGGEAESAVGRTEGTDYRFDLRLDPSSSGPQEDMSESSGHRLALPPASDLLNQRGLSPHLERPPEIPPKREIGGSVDRPPIRTARPRTSSEAAASRWLLPLVWINRVFDWCTHPLGHLGRWLRGDFGRSVLGWTGVALLLAAIGWGCLNWLGWIR